MSESEEVRFCTEYRNEIQHDSFLSCKNPYKINFMEICSKCFVDTEVEIIKGTRQTMFI